MLKISSGGQFVGRSDLSWAGIPFMREVYGIGSDVTDILYQQLSHRSYFNMIVEKSGLNEDPPQDTSRLLLALAAKGRLFTEVIFPNEPVNELLYPLGPILRAATSADKKPNTLQIYAANSHLYRELIKIPVLAQAIPTTPVERSILDKYALVWEELEDAFKAVNPRVAEQCRAYRNIFERPKESQSNTIGNQAETFQKK